MLDTKTTSNSPPTQKCGSVAYNKESDCVGNIALEPGICVKIQGLHRATHLNGKYGTLLYYHTEGPAAHLWGVRCDYDGKNVDVRPENLALPVTDERPQAITFNLPPLIDRWDDLTSTEDLLDEETVKACRRMAANAESIEEAEHDIYAYIHEKHKDYDAHFPDLFLFDNKTYAKMNVRFETYVSWLLRQHHTNALQHDGWIAFVTNRAAVIRHVLKRPPLWQMTSGNHQEILSPRQLMSLHVLVKLDEKKAFCFRYLFGDVEASQVAELYLHDCLNRMHNRKKMQRPFVLDEKPDP